MKLKLIDKRALTDKIWQMRFEAPGIEARPGQFVNIAVEGHYLRRPISVSEYEDGVLTLLIQTVGEGTRLITAMPEGSESDMLTGLGNGFSLPEPQASNDRADKAVTLLLGGGIGYAPLVGLMKRLNGVPGQRTLAVFGFNGAEDVPRQHLEELRREGLDVEHCTMSGDSGLQGNAVETAAKLLESRGLEAGYLYACGPIPMMKAAGLAFGCEAQMSLEARMGCGFGACMGCSIKTTKGMRRICKEGPVFLKSELPGYNNDTNEL